MKVKLNRKELELILGAHKKWFNNNPDGQRANLRGADLDFSCWPLWCGSQNVKIDENQAKQLLAHAFNTAREFWPGVLTEDQINWLNGFHRIKSNEFPKFV